MILKLIVAACGIGLYLIIDAANRAPVGYEDERGFHFGKEPNNNRKHQ